MVRMVIASELLKQRGPLNKATLNSLHVRGGGIQVDDALGRWGWNGTEPVVTSVITIDHATAVVRGTRFETRGGLEHPVKIKASELWPGAAEGVEIHIRFTNLGIIDWVTQGDFRNVSHWLEDKDVDHDIIKDNAVIPDDEKEENGIFGFALRFTILPADVEKSLLYASILPYSKAELGEKLQEVNKTLDSPVIPTLALKLFKSGAKTTNAHAIALLPKERPGDRFGLGHLPLLEVVGDGRPNFPHHDEIEKELASFLRATVGTNNTSLPRLEGLFASPEVFPKFASGTIPRDWPSYRGPLQEEEPEVAGAASDSGEVDSMSGETAEDDLALLIENVSRQALPPAMVQPGQFPGTATAIARSLATAGGTGGGLPVRGGLPVSGGLAGRNLDTAFPGAEPSYTSLEVQKMLGNQQKTLDMVAALLREKSDSREKEEVAVKRKSKEESTMSPQEPVLFLEESYKIEDDAHETIDTKLRQRLRPINADPKEWWVKGAFNRVETPVLGASLYTEHLMPGMVAEQTILKAHDRGSHLELKNYLTKNSNVFSESKKKLKVIDNMSGEMHMDIRTDWQSANTVWEAVDAGLNYCAVEFQIRQYNYSPLAMIRCLHECRYFCGLSTTPKQQMTLIVEFFNTCFTKNKSAARDGKHAVTFVECQEVAKRVLAANKITSFTNFFSGDPYIGSNREEIRRKNERIVELEKENKRLRSEAGRSTYSKGRDSARQESAEDKKKRTCRDWNESDCVKKGGKAGYCGFGSGARKHGCGKILDPTNICWAQDHQEKDCPK